MPGDVADHVAYVVVAAVRAGPNLGALLLAGEVVVDHVGVVEAEGQAMARAVPTGAGLHTSIVSMGDALLRQVELETDA